MATVIYSERHLRCLSLKPALRFFAISSSLSGSWMMRGTTSSTFVSGFTPGRSKSASKSRTVLAIEADAKEVETDEDVGTGVGAFLVALVEDFFFAGDGQWK